jgi:hypothetical protein
MRFARAFCKAPRVVLERWTSDVTASLQGEALFLRLSAQHSTMPLCAEDVTLAVDLASRDVHANSFAEMGTLFRTLGAATFLVPFVTSSVGHRMLLTFAAPNDDPRIDSRGRIAVVFTSRARFASDHSENVAVQPLEMSAGQLFETLENVNRTNALGARVTVLSIDRKFLQPWNDSGRRLWLFIVNTAWTRRTLQAAKSDEEIVAALRDDRGTFFFAKHMSEKNEWTPRLFDLGARGRCASALRCALAFAASDLGERMFPDSPTSSSDSVSGKRLLDFVLQKELDVALVHNLSEKGEVGLVRLTREMVFKHL